MLLSRQVLRQHGGARCSSARLHSGQQFKTQHLSTRCSPTQQRPFKVTPHAASSGGLPENRSADLISAPGGPAPSPASPPAAAADAAVAAAAAAAPPVQPTDIILVPAPGSDIPGATLADAAVSSEAPGPPQPPPQPLENPTPSPLPGPADLAHLAVHFKALAVVLAATGAALVATPEGPLQALINRTPTALEMLFVRIVGVTTLFKASLSYMLQGSAERAWLDSITSQRVMLGMMMRSITNLLAFKSISSAWVVIPSPFILLAYPILMAYSFAVNMVAFSPYNPYFLVKVVWPLAAGVLLAQAIPKAALALDAAHLPGSAHSHWFKAGALAILPAKASGLLAAVAKVLGKVLAKVGPKLIVKKSFTAFMPKDAGPPLAKTVVKKMDFAPPSTGVAWCYFAIMAAHFLTLFEAFAPEVLFVGAPTQFSKILKMTWSSGFLAAAFSCDALKTAAESGTLELTGNMQLNLFLAALEVCFGACMVYGITNGLVVARNGWLRVATSAIAAAFFLVQYRAARSQQTSGPEGVALQSSVATIGLQAEGEKQASHVMISAIAAIVLTVACTIK